MRAVCDDTTLIAYLSKLKTVDNISRTSVSAKECFNTLYAEARALVANLYNSIENEKYNNLFLMYQDKLSNNDRLFDYEKIERLKKFRDEKRTFSSADITESDIEQIIYSAIPTDRYGNLSPLKASKLSEQFVGKRFSRQRIREILSGNTEISRFDLITLNFFIFSQKLSEYSDAKTRYVEFLESTNRILNKCLMGKMYVQNPYECFVLMCILSLDPLGTYADVWEFSYTT